MADAKPLFVDCSNEQPRPMNFWAPLVMTGAKLEAEAARLADFEIPRGGRRRSRIVHPSATAPGLGFAPGIEVTLNVLRPGDSTIRYRQNSSQVAMCIRGAAIATVGRRSLAFEQFDVWNIPSMEVYRYENRGPELAVFLSYSNAPLLEKLEVHYVEEDAAEPAAAVAAVPAAMRAKDFADDLALGGDGARLLGYEHLIDIDVVPSRALLWPWRTVEQYLSRVEKLGGAAGKAYRGRHLYLLYNPATERRNGTTHAFFATIAQYPPNRVDIPHRHSSAAINYIFGGSGRSVVDGHRFEWQAGDIMLSAPAWAVHNHAAGPDGCRILTVQDHPLHIAMESLIWQETLKEPVVKLGNEVGAQTNLGKLVARG
jgi:gentisate 1,2-dioxygenase